MAEAAWEPVPRPRTFELVLARIEERILAGDLRVGDRLPPERELVRLLGVSRAAVREALRVLEAQGVLRSRVGTGPASGSVVVALPGEGLARLLRLHVALATFPLDEVAGAGAVLERACARLAAERAGPDDLARMRDPLVRMDAAGLPRERFHAYDADFHAAIAEAGGDRLAGHLATAVRAAARPALLAALHRIADWEAAAARLRADHHLLYRAIAAGDAARAGEAMEAHIRCFHQEFVRPALGSAGSGAGG